MMQQWQECKENSKGALLLFRLGDFYEAFHEDAHTLAKELELTLTKRQDVPMSGIPAHTVDNYIDRLVSKGFKVAIAEQVEDPKTAVGIVKRKIVRIVTPGTHSSSHLAEKSNQFISSLVQVGSIYGLATCDLTTGKFTMSEFEEERELFNEIHRLKPKEILTTKKFKEKCVKALSSFFVVCQEEWFFDHKMAYAFLTNHFKVHHLDGFGLKGKISLINACGGLLCYLQEELSLCISHIQPPEMHLLSETLSIDSATEKHLELSELLKILDYTLTPMGGRKLNLWLKKPLLNPTEIRKRHAAISYLMNWPIGPETIRSYLKQVRDLERLMTKIATAYANPKDLVSFRISLEQIAPLKEVLKGAQDPVLQAITNELIDVSDLILLLKNSLVEEPPIKTTEGHLFKEGYNLQLDELTKLATHGKDWLASYQTELKEQTGIKTLKIVYNKVFGYTIEVSQGASKNIPEFFETRQTLANTCRYTTKTLKEYESKVIVAEEKKIALEQELFRKLILEVAEFKDPIFKIASAIAHLDALSSLYEIARKNDYVQPYIDGSLKLEIKGGRHPVVETLISKENFISNDTFLNESEKLMVITGPNMAGKSTYIRQVALIVIMAQMGSFVPAQEVHIGIVDKIFSRIGASDDLNRGQSTFMVEMSETANIVNNATNRSLVILDEIGRGTSTYDGLSIAWAVAEYLMNKQPKTLFATHYFELTALENSHSCARNYHAVVKEVKEEIIFLHKIDRGVADRSYGIHVARLAGLPLPIIARATEILSHLEQKGSRKESMQKLNLDKKELKVPSQQLTLF